MTPLSCHLQINSDDRHLQHLLTGFAILHREKTIDVRQQIIPIPPPNPQKPQHLRDAWRCQLKVILNDEVRLIYDCHDSQEIDETLLSDMDVYFKRSYSKTLHGNLETVLPMGLYHPVYPNFFDQFAFKRAFSLSTGLDKLRGALYTMDLKNRFHFTTRQSVLEQGSSPAHPPKVIFMARAWDPEEGVDRLPEKKEERQRINEFRAELIRRLRKEFGQNFIGGLAPSEYARAHYKDCLLSSSSDAKARNYMGLVSSAAICIATMGLHGSVGAKFSEYVAMGKAIVTEPLGIEVPGDLRAGTHYLEFSTPEQCVTQVRNLFDDPASRTEMMTANLEYYQDYLRPDSLVLNSLKKAVGCLG